jgi:hypothetical protein
MASASTPASASASSSQRIETSSSRPVPDASETEARGSPSSALVTYSARPRYPDGAGRTVRASQGTFTVQ